MARAPVLPLALALLVASACTRPATEVRVDLDTNAPVDRALTITATVFVGTATDGPGPAARAWVRGGATGDTVLPGSFAVVPAPGERRDDTVTLVLAAELAGDDAGHAPLRFRRLVRFAFTPYTPTRLPVFLAIECGGAAAGCTTPGVPCTVAQRCEEMDLTCGDTGTCVSRVVQPMPIAPDAGGGDAAADALAGDAPVPDAPAADAPQAVGPPPPRPIAPLSTAAVTSSRPTFHWQPAPGTDGAHLEVCDDRACAHGVGIDAPAAGPGSLGPLTPGVHYWRVFGVAGGVRGSTPSPTWEFFVPAHTTSVDTSWGTVLDANGDGFADVAAGALTRTMPPGSVLVYHGSATGLAATPATRITDPGTGDTAFGVAIASAGDTDGDGYADLVVGAPAAMGQTGTIHVYRGGPAGLASTPAVTIVGPGGMPGSFGVSVAGAGDVNGDGYADVIVGAPSEGGGRGGVYVFPGSATGLLPTPFREFHGTGSQQVGGSVASMGDLSADGYAEFAYGDLLTGNVVVVSGSPVAGTTTVVSVAAPGGTATVFGTMPQCPGDFDGDGRPDLVVGAAFENSSQGRAYVYRGADLALNMVRPTALSAAGSFAFGRVLSAGDVTGDGFDDVAIGSSYAVDVFLGSATGFAAAAVHIPRADGLSANFASGLTARGDVHGDGIADIVAGDPMSSPGARVYLYRGSAGGPATTPTQTIDAPAGTPTGAFGWTVARATPPNPRLVPAYGCAAPWRGARALTAAWSGSMVTDPCRLGRSWL